MAHSPGYPAAQRAWARVRLTRGSSTGEIWEISSDYPEARLSVGTDPGAGWPIQAPGVQPVHCELFWDGQSLWVADTHGAGGVFLDGRRVVDWAQIEGPAELRLGQAALDVETSAPLHEQMVSSPNAARPVTLTDLVAPPDDGRRSRPIFGGAASDDSIPELDVAATRVVASPAPDLDAERTRVASAPSAAPNADLRPRLGGSGSAVTSEATRMVAMPTARPASAPPPPPPRTPQALAPAPVVAPPPAPPSIAAPPALPPTLSAEPDPSIAPPAPPSGGPAFVGPPVEPKPPAKTSGFAQVAQQVLAKLRPQSSAEVVQASGGKASQTLPVRTWILLGVTVAAAVGLLLWEEEPEEIAAPQPAAQTEQAPVVVAGTGAQQGAAPSTPVVSPQPVAPQPPVVEPVAQPANPAVEAPPATPSTPVADGSQATPSANQAPVGPSMQRQAIDLYVAGRYPEALALYRQLAATDPANEAYASMVHILESRVRCHDGVGPGGQPCTE